MHPRRNKEKFQQLTEFVWRRIIGLTEVGFSCYAKGAHRQRNSSTVMQIWKQWTDKLRTTRKTGSERRKETSASDNRYLIHMVVNDRASSSRQLAARWSLATAQHVQLLPRSAYSPDMSPIEHVEDLVGRRLARDPYPAAAKNELLRRIQVIWNSFPQSRHSKSV
ncbi:uncharacterized protein TNCV_3442211 [Trichonephila clavipes]|nr:uncharacterized protein TNCV_3442211 [Trichonephila clavipes]